MNSYAFTIKFIIIMTITLSTDAITISVSFAYDVNRPTSLHSHVA